VEIMKLRKKVTSLDFQLLIALLNWLPARPAATRRKGQAIVGFSFIRSTSVRLRRRK